MCRRLARRGVAQPGRAPALGAGSRRFESCLPDQSSLAEHSAQSERPAHRSKGDRPSARVASSAPGTPGCGRRRSLPAGGSRMPVRHSFSWCSFEQASSNPRALASDRSPTRHGRRHLARRQCERYPSQASERHDPATCSEGPGVINTPGTAHRRRRSGTMSDVAKMMRILAVSVLLGAMAPAAATSQRGHTAPQTLIVNCGPGPRHDQPPHLRPLRRAPGPLDLRRHLDERQALASGACVTTSCRRSARSRSPTCAGPAGALPTTTTGRTASAHARSGRQS